MRGLIFALALLGGVAHAEESVSLNLSAPAAFGFDGFATAGATEDAHWIGVGIEREFGRKLFLRPGLGVAAAWGEVADPAPEAVRQTVSIAGDPFRAPVTTHDRDGRAYLLMRLEAGLRCARWSFGVSWTGFEGDEAPDDTLGLFAGWRF